MEDGLFLILPPKEKNLYRCWESVNPVVLLPEILKSSSEEWAKTIAQSVTLGSGQFCTNPAIMHFKNPDQSFR